MCKILGILVIPEVKTNWMTPILAELHIGRTGDTWGDSLGSGWRKRFSDKSYQGRNIETFYQMAVIIIQLKLLCLYLLDKLNYV